MWKKEVQSLKQLLHVHQKHTRTHIYILKPFGGGNVSGYEEVPYIIRWGVQNKRDNQMAKQCGQAITALRVSYTATCAFGT